MLVREHPACAAQAAELGDLVARFAWDELAGSLSASIDADAGSDADSDAESEGAL